VNLLEDNNTVGEQPAANSALCYAAWTGSIPMMDTLIQKGAGKCSFNLPKTKRNVTFISVQEKWG